MTTNVFDIEKSMSIKDRFRIVHNNINMDRKTQIKTKVYFDNIKIVVVNIMVKSQNRELIPTYRTDYSYLTMYVKPLQDTLKLICENNINTLVSINEQFEIRFRYNKTYGLLKIAKL